MADRDLLFREEGALGNRIRSLLKRSGLTQAALAEAAGIAQPTLAHYLSGRTAPTPEIAARMARALGVPVQELELRAQKARGRRSLPGRIDREQVRTRLEKLGMNAADLARSIGVSKQAVSSYMAGMTMPKATTLRRLARALGLELEQLVTTDAPDEPAPRKAPARRKPASSAGARGTAKAKR